MMKNGKVKRWRKVLYEDNQGFPDNYTPTESFLAAIEKNKDLRLYSLQECLQGAAEVGKEVSSVVVFWCTHSLLLTHSLSPSSLLTAMAALLLLLGLYRQAVYGCSLLAGLRTVLLFSVIGYALSPVLCQLTSSISTDTVRTMAGGGLALHLLTRDYGVPAPIVSSSTSLNAAVFSAVCLASRFDHHLAAFCLLSLCVLLFLLLPLLPLPLLSSSLLHFLAALLSLHLTSTPSSLLLALLLLLTLHILCPLLFHRLQSAKRTIHGPWDEAVLK